MFGIDNITHYLESISDKSQSAYISIHVQFRNFSLEVVIRCCYELPHRQQVLTVNWSYFLKACVSYLFHKR